MAIVTMDVTTYYHRPSGTFANALWFDIDGTRRAPVMLHRGLHAESEIEAHLEAARWGLNYVGKAVKTESSRITLYSRRSDVSRAVQRANAAGERPHQTFKNNPGAVRAARALETTVRRLNHKVTAIHVPSTNKAKDEFYRRRLDILDRRAQETWVRENHAAHGGIVLDLADVGAVWRALGGLRKEPPRLTPWQMLVYYLVDELGHSASEITEAMIPVASRPGKKGKPTPQSRAVKRALDTARQAINGPAPARVR